MPFGIRRSRHERRTVMVAAFVLMAVGTTATTAQEKTVEETVAFSPGGRLSIEASGGSVHLSAWDEPQVDVRARVTAVEGVDADCARAAVDAVLIAVRQQNDALEIRAERGDRPRDCAGARGGLSRVAYEIRAPRVLDLEVEVTQGEATVTGFNGDIRVEGDQGQVRASHLTGEIRLDSSRGQLDASDLAGQVRLHVDRGGGQVSDVRGSLALDVSRGRLELRSVRFDGNSTAEVDHGGLDLGFVEDQGLTISGDIRRGGLIVEALSLTQTTDRGKVETTINGGGPRLHVAAREGSVRLHPN